MGYYTKYELRTHESEKDISEILKQIPEDEFEDDFYPLDTDGDSEDTAKWYEHEDSIKELSLKHPDIVFELSGEGEESGDIWKKYFKNGKIQYCCAKVTFDDYCEDLLE